MAKTIIWNSRACGRCGGTGKYHFAVGGAASQGVCYGCSGAGRLMSPATRRHLLAFRDWQKQERPTEAQALAALDSGRFGRAWKVVEAPAAAPVR